MPAYPWRKWFPQDWISDPGLAMCEPATRGIWADAVNIMLLSGKPFIEGTDEQLSRSLRCRPVQLQAAVCELKQFNVCIVEMQNACTRLASRRLLREQETKADKQKAAFTRWDNECRTDAEGMQTPMQTNSDSAYARSASASDSLGEPERGTGENQFELMRENLNGLYDRDPKKRWSSMEERLLFDVVRENPDCLAELADLRNYERKTKYFPKSITSLLSDWGKHLDAAKSETRNGQKEQAEKPKTIMDKELESIRKAMERI